MSNLELPEAMGLGNCCYHRMELRLQPSVEVAPKVIEKAKKVLDSETASTEPFAPDQDSRIEPVKLKHIGESRHLDGLIRNRPDPREDMNAFGEIHNQNSTDESNS